MGSGGAWETWVWSNGVGENSQTGLSPIGRAFGYFLTFLTPEIHGSRGAIVC